MRRSKSDRQILIKQVSNLEAKKNFLSPAQIAICYRIRMHCCSLK